MSPIPLGLCAQLTLSPALCRGISTGAFDNECEKGRSRWIWAAVDKSEASWLLRHLVQEAYLIW